MSRTRPPGMPRASTSAAREASSSVCGRSNHPVTLASSTSVNWLRTKKQRAAGRLGPFDEAAPTMTRHSVTSGSVVGCCNGRGGWGCGSVAVDMRFPPGQGSADGPRTCAAHLSGGCSLRTPVRGRQHGSERGGWPRNPPVHGRGVRSTVGRPSRPSRRRPAHGRTRGGPRPTPLATSTGHCLGEHSTRPGNKPPRLRCLRRVPQGPPRRRGHRVGSPGRVRARARGRTRPPHTR